MLNNAKTNFPATSSRLDPGQFWYVPNRKLRTKSAAKKAIEVVQWIDGQRSLDKEPDEQTLFLAMHTCAYWAVRRIRRIKSVSAAKRVDWVRRWRIIREYIVEKNLGLVYSMLGRFSNQHLDEDDLQSEAMYALTRAVDRFNPHKGYRFSTYACNAIARALMRLGKRTNRRRDLFPIQHDISFEIPAKLPDTQADLYLERLNRILDQNLGNLTDLETEILNQRFMSNQKQKLTFQQIGDTVGLSKERVRQIQNIALGKLRAALNVDPVLA